MDLKELKQTSTIKLEPVGMDLRPVTEPAKELTTQQLEALQHQKVLSELIVAKETIIKATRSLNSSNSYLQQVLDGLEDELIQLKTQYQLSRILIEANGSRKVLLEKLEHV